MQYGMVSQGSIRESVDSLYRDDTSEISRDPRRDAVGRAHRARPHRQLPPCSIIWRLSVSTVKIYRRDDVRQEKNRLMSVHISVDRGDI